MSSKEALKDIFDILINLERLSDVHDEQDIKKQKFDIVKKDLDRLEELEKNTIEQRKIVLLTKDMVYFDTFTEKYFIKFLDFLNDNEVYCHIDTIYDFTEIWFSSCGKRKLYKLIIEFNNKETNNDK